MSGKSSKIETDRRIFIIQGWIMNRVPDYLILKQCVDQFTAGDSTKKITERQAKNYIAKAYKIWHDANEATIEQERQLSIDRLKDQIRSMKSDYKGTPAGIRAVIAAEREINRLRGAYVPKAHIIKGDPESPVVIVTDEATREKRIAQLIAKAMEK